MAWDSIFQGVLIVGFPALAIWITKRFSTANWISPVVLCYAVGIVIANLVPITLQTAIPNTFTKATIMFAIPLLLLNTDVLAWLKQAKNTLVSFALCVLSGFVATIFVTWLFADKLPNSWRYAGMMFSLFTGGVPNMQAVALMLNATEEEILLVSMADILCGGIYLMFLTSVAHRFFGLFLTPYVSSVSIQAHQLNNPLPIQWRQVLLSLALAVFSIGITLGVTWLFTGEIASIVLILLLLTSVAIALSFIPAIRQLPNTFEVGEYFLLMFCVALGLLADFSTVLEKGGTVLYFMACIWLGVAGLHALLAYFFRIDRDTYLITSTAAIYGPIFIGQVATAIGNRDLVFSGIATGLIGYAIGNYAGYGIGQLLYAWLY
jgi:uncharacterized membrane protein